MPPMLERKITNCVWCDSPFLMTRRDARFCSKSHAMKFHNKKAVWTNRPDRFAQNQQRAVRYQANREVELAKQKEKRIANPELFRAKERAEYQRNKQKHMMHAKAYRKAHPEKRNPEYRRSRQKYPWLRCLVNAERRALKKKFPFELTREWCLQNWTGKCAITSLDFIFGTQTYYPFSPSIDRIDSSKGYLQNNCRFVLFAVNSLKGIGTDEQMLQIAKAIADQKAAPPML